MRIIGKNHLPFTPLTSYTSYCLGLPEEDVKDIAILSGQIVTGILSGGITFTEAPISMAAAYVACRFLRMHNITACVVDASIIDEAENEGDILNHFTSIVRFMVLRNDAIIYIEPPVHYRISDDCRYELDWTLLTLCTISKMPVCVSMAVGSDTEITNTADNIETAWEGRERW
jgi:hypothetical protein